MFKKVSCISEYPSEIMIHLSITTHNDLLPAKHYICGSLQAGRHKQNNTDKNSQYPSNMFAMAGFKDDEFSPIQDGFTAAVKVVELLLGD